MANMKDKTNSIELHLKVFEVPNANIAYIFFIVCYTGWSG